MELSHNNQPTGIASLEVAAVFIGVSMRTLYRLIAEGRIKTVSIGTGRRKGIRREDLTKFLADNQG